MNLDSKVTILRNTRSSSTVTSTMVEPIQPETPVIDPPKKLTLAVVYSLIVGVQKDLSSQIKTVRDKFDTQNIEENKSLKSRLDEQDKNMAALLYRIETCESTLKLQRGQLEESKREVSQLKSENGRHNNIVHGIKEIAMQSPREIIKELFCAIGLPDIINNTDTIYRLGAKPKNGKRSRARPIFVEMIRKADRGEIYRHIKNLKDKPKWTRVTIMDDQTPEENQKTRSQGHLYSCKTKERRCTHEQ